MKLKLFLSFLFLYITIGFWLCYNNTFIITDNNIFFGSDCARVYTDLTTPIASHYRITVHPLMVLLLQPVVSFLNIFFHDAHRAVIVLQSLIAASNVCLIFSILKSLTKNKSTSLIFASLYGVSFSTLIFTALPETYIFSAFFQLLLWNYAIDLTKKSSSLEWKNILIVALLGVMSTGIILSNVITFLITVIWLLWSVYKKDWKRGLMNFAKITLTFCALLISLAWIQKYCFIHVPFFLEKLGKAFNGPEHFEDFKYLDLTFSWEKLNDTLVQMFAAPVLAPDLLLIPGQSETLPDFQINCGFSWKNLISGVSLYLLPLIMMFRRTKHTSLLVTIAVILLLNFIMLFFYGSKECFIYSQNYLYLIFIFAGVLINNHLNIFYRLFFQLAIILNLLTLRQIDITIFNFTLANNFHFKWILHALVVTAAVALVIKLFKPKFKDKYFYWINFYIIFIMLTAILSNISKIRG